MIPTPRAIKKMNPGTNGGLFRVATPLGYTTTPVVVPVPADCLTPVAEGFYQPIGFNADGTQLLASDSGGTKWFSWPGMAVVDPAPYVGSFTHGLPSWACLDSSLHGYLSYDDTTAPPSNNTVVEVNTDGSINTKLYRDGANGNGSFYFFGWCPTDSFLYGFRVASAGFGAGATALYRFTPGATGRTTMLTGLSLGELQPAVTGDGCFWTTTNNPYSSPFQVARYDPASNTIAYSATFTDPLSTEPMTTADNGVVINVGSGPPYTGYKVSSSMDVTPFTCPAFTAVEGNGGTFGRLPTKFDGSQSVVDDGAGAHTLWSLP